MRDTTDETGKRTNGIYIFGAGGHAKVVFALLEACNREVAAFIDRAPAGNAARFLGRPVYHSDRLLEESGILQGIIAIGDNKDRRNTDQLWKSRIDWPRFVHPHSWIHSSVECGEGTVVMAGAVIQPYTAIGRHCIVNTMCSVDHDCRIGDYVHLAPGAHIAGGVSIGDGSLLGVGASVIPGVAVGRNCMIGAGAAVVSNIPDYAVAAGVPARVIKSLQ